MNVLAAKPLSMKKNAKRHKGTLMMSEKYPTEKPVLYSIIVAMPLKPAGANWFLTIKSM